MEALQAVIKYSEMLAQMRRIDHRGQPARFDLEFVKCSLTKQYDAGNGQIKKVKGLCLLKLLPNQSASFSRNFGKKPKYQGADTLPKAWEEKLLKLADPDNGEVIGIYSRLILSYNGITVTE